MTPRNLLYLTGRSLLGRSIYGRRLAREHLFRGLGESIRALFSNSRHRPSRQEDPDYGLTDQDVTGIIRALGRHQAGISSVTGTSIGTVFKWAVGQTVTGGYMQQVTGGGNIAKTYAMGTAAANNVTGGGDEVVAFQQAIAAGASFTLDLTSVTNVLLVAAVNLARVKGAQIRVLSTTDDATITPAPTATSTVTVTNIGPAVPSGFDFGNGGSGLTVALTVSGGAVTAVAIGAAGSGYPASSAFLASPQQAGGSGCVFGVVTNASGVPTSVVFIAGAGGAGYSAATVPTVPVGQYNILTGGAHVYFDPLAAGFTLPTATNKNLKFINMDGTNGVTCEIDLLGAQS